MVPAATIAAMVFTLVVSFAVPLGGLLVLRRYAPRVGRAFACGMLAFFVSQVLTRLPLMTLVVPSLAEPARGFLTSVPVASFTAGLFEETGRLVVMLLLLKGFHRLADGIAFGLGHGGLEAMLLVGLTYVSNLVLAVLMNTGGWASIAASLPAANAEAIEKAMTGLPASTFALAGVERIGAIGLHVVLSLVILAGVVHGRKALAWVVAVLIHGLANLGVLSAMGAGVPTAAVEVGFLVVIAALLWLAIRRLGPTLPATIGVPSIAGE